MTCCFCAATDRPPPPHPPPSMALHGGNNGQNQFQEEASGSGHVSVWSLKNVLSLFSSWTSPGQPFIWSLGLLTRLPRLLHSWFWFRSLPTLNNVSLVFSTNPMDFYYPFLFFKEASLQLSDETFTSCYPPTTNSTSTTVFILKALEIVAVGSCVAIVVGWFGHLTRLYL